MNARRRFRGTYWRHYQGRRARNTRSHQEAVGKISEDSDSLIKANMVYTEHVVTLRRAAFVKYGLVCKFLTSDRYRDRRPTEREKSIERVLKHAILTFRIYYINKILDIIHNFKYV